MRRTPAAGILFSLLPSRRVAVLAVVASLAVVPAVEASPEPPFPAVLAEADQGTTLAVTPLADGRSGLFVRDLGADDAAGPWQLVATDALEHLGFLHMAIQDKLGSGYGSALKIVTP